MGTSGLLGSYNSSTARCLHNVWNTVVLSFVLPTIQHAPLIETMQQMAEAEAKYHKKHKRYLEVKQCPQKSSSKSISWSKCATQFKMLPWNPPSKVIGSYKIEATKNSFVITGLIDVDGDGKSATYVSTHTSPKPKRIGDPKEN